jgi:hypothetical protein
MKKAIRKPVKIYFDYKIFKDKDGWYYVKSNMGNQYFHSIEEAKKWIRDDASDGKIYMTKSFKKSIRG